MSIKITGTGSCIPNNIIENKEFIKNNFFDKDGNPYPNSNQDIIDRFEDGYYIGRTEFDSPDVDNNVLIKSESVHLRIGEFYDVKVNDSTEYDLIAELV